MAKIKGPLFSLKASGSIGPRLTYSQRKSGPQVRIQKEQADYENAARETARNAYRYGIELWNYLTPTEKAYWTQVEKKGYADV